ncbi:MAG TPA: carboxypeptidase regulatory-like domain-containing protein [Saprospiraceae bacterium]|nr:carboxypeptidase regulatory-like domain-containing protein [Saprospiraceae bacterium]
MVRSLLLTFAMLLMGAAVAMAQSTTTLTGTITDGNEPLIGATVKVLKGTSFVRGTVTDYNGEYRVNLDPGTYDVEFSYTGFQAQKITGVRVLGGQITTQNVTMSNSTVLEEVEIIAYKVPLIEQDQTSSGQTLTSEQIKNLPTRSVNTIVATTVGATSIDGGDVNIKGARSNGTDYYIDGIRVSGGVPPVQDFEQISVITSGVGAEIGDLTGGFISGTTKGPAGEFHGGIDVENSKGLDAFGYLLATANVSGPIIKKKLADGKTRTVLGFRLSGQYQTRNEDDPPALPVYRAKESVIAQLEQHPITRLGTNLVNSAEYLTNNDVDRLKARPYQTASNLDLNGKIDMKLTSNIDISLTGTYTDNRDLVDGGGELGEAGWFLLNAQNNPTNFSNTYRGNFRFRHRLGNTEAVKPDNGNSKRVSISNASYQLQFAYERNTSRTYDKRHKDRLFDYGYIGKFETIQDPIAEPNDNAVWTNVGYNDRFIRFTPGGINPVLEAYNEFAVKDEEDIAASLFPAELTFLTRNGFVSDVYNDVWGGMYSNVGLSFNRFEKSENDIATLNATVNFDLKLGKTGTHNIQFGLLNEQRTNRFYRVAPNSLYLWATQYANIHFNGLDTSQVIDTMYFDPPGVDVPLHPYATVDLPENRFYRAVRESLGVPLNEWVNVNGLTPDQLSLSMFSPRELMDQGLVSYYGYDYLGNRTSEGITFNDFFRSRAIDNVRDFPNAPLRPLYQAAWLKDKFTFNKMIFSLGVRVERFDLNTKVLKDPYSLYRIMDAKTFYETVPTNSDRPNTIGDDFKVYTASEQDNTITAFRSGDTWYFPDGRQANDGNVIFGGGVVNPYLFNPEEDVTTPEFDPSGSFDDYTPQVNWLPRLAFSFPISEKANFFAHYDILVQRPPSNWEVTPRSYFYFYRPGTKNNANLLPERVVDYEVGFQQELNKRSAIKFSAYYREFRDMIQRRTILFVPVIGSYDTYGNIDFATVKGFTWQYDLRRTKNVELRIAYTLQFADGTGSDSESQRGLTQRGNVRYLFPLNYDERHNLNTTIDYRFDGGKAYTGPIIAGKKILADFGVNLIATAASGRPYTQKFRPARFGANGTVGSVNGSRLPWRFNLDFRVDKTFRLNQKAKKPLDLNVYFRVANLLNRLNVLGVYAATGSPTDDGYLSIPDGQSVVRQVEESGLNPQAYLDSYSWLVRNPNNFALPRRVFLGASFTF